MRVHESKWSRNNVAKTNKHPFSCRSVFFLFCSCRSRHFIRAGSRYRLTSGSLQSIPYSEPVRASGKVEYVGAYFASILESPAGRTWEEDSDTRWKPSDATWTYTFW